MARFKLFPRFRRPSLRTALGVTKAERTIKRKSGFYAATKITRLPYNTKRTILRRAGYYSGPMKLLRWLFKKH